MKFTALISLAAAMLAVVEAGSQGVEVPIILKSHHKKDFHAAMAKVSHRYPQLNLAPRLKASKTGRIPLVDVNHDSEYYSAVKIGTPGQTMRLNFDTGSSDIWFPSALCQEAACKSHKRFNFAKSSTYKKDGRKWEVLYGDNSGASGILGSDMVNVGGIKVRQTIGLSTNETAEFESSPEEGLFGLGFSSLESVEGVKTFMDNAIAAKAIAKPVISAFLPSVRRNGGKNGSYLFGAIDSSRYTGNLTYVPVTKQGYWQIHISNVKVQGKSLHMASEGIVDTGSSLLVLGDKVAAAIHKNIKGSRLSKEIGGWTLPCSVGKSKGSISFTLGGKDFQVPLADLTYTPIAAGSKTCYSGVQGGENDLWILGDVFIKNNYCVFDHSAKASIGIAPLKY
ncbi:Type I transmembrane sorting receptor [Mortierella sp. AD094]|nr:Type I transmembrane sorting receptor [Mortierella sp. AD094]